MFAEQCGMTLDLDDWRETLIRMAVPFARTAVTVVAPDGYEVRSRVQNEAARHGIEIRVVPRSSFSREAVEQIVCWYGARPLAGTACTKFSEATEREFGERADANSNLLPAWLRDYGHLR
jgi:hypothetical protein